MGLFDAPARQAAKGRLFPAATGLFRASGGQRDLQSRVAELETLQQQFGAPEIEQDKPGIFSKIIDVLSRPIFGIAGATEELLQGQGVTSAVSRMTNEILSGVGPFQGEKRAFGQVLEGLGVGTVTLADAFPALDGTWVGNFGSRGAAGLALDIFADPLTYMTFGASTLGKIGFLKRGTRFLSKSGVDELAKIRAPLEKGLKTLDDPLDAAARRTKIDREVEEAFFSRFGEDLSDELLDPGGIKLFGKSLVRGETLGSIRSSVADAARRVPGGAAALEGGAKLSIGMRRAINGIFHPFNELGNLPPEMRDVAIRLRRDFASASTAHRGRVRGVMVHGLDLADGSKIGADLGKRYSKLAKADEELGRKFYEIREGTGSTKLSDLSPEAQAVYNDMTKVHDLMGETMVRAGVIDSTKSNYFARHYNNIDELDQYHFSTSGQFSGKIGERLTRERVFDTYAEAVEESKRLNDLAKRQMSQGRANRLYPVLEPNYDLLGNLNRHIDQYADLIARKAWQEQAVHSFGRKIDDFDLNALYESLEPIAGASAREVAAAERFIDGKNFREIVEQEQTTIRTGPSTGVKGPKIDRGEATTNVLQEASAMMRGFSTAGRQEFIRQIINSSNSSPQLSSIINHLWDFKDDFPVFRALKDGELDQSYAKFFGTDAAYVPVKSAMTADIPTMMPKIIYEDLANVNSKLLNTKDYKAFGSLIKGFDTVNNMFKLGVYSFWPASMVRDAYSNVALSMLDIGVGALDPKLHAASVGILARRNGILRTKHGVEYSYKELRNMARDLGVYVPGEVFAELTGDAAKSGTKLKGLKKAARLRGMIENEARVQLWINNIRRGIDPRNAADHVQDFLFNYGELSSVERELFRRAIPFYTFTRKNIQLQAKMLRKNPGMVINQLKPFLPRNDESEQMVKWEAEGLGIRLDRDGKTVHAIQGIDLPLRNLDTLWAGGVGATGRRIMGMLTPLIKTPIEAVTGRDFFTGGDLKRARGDTLGRILDNKATPRGVKDWLGFKKELDDAGRPRYTFDGVRYSLLVRSWMFSRVFSTTDRQFREYLGDQNTAAALLDFMTGMRSKEINLDEQGQRKLERRIKQLEQSLVRRGAFSEFTKPFAGKGERDLQ